MIAAELLQVICFYPKNVKELSRILYSGIETICIGNAYKNTYRNAFHTLEMTLGKQIPEVHTANFSHRPTL